MKQTTSNATLVTLPARPAGAVVYCPCGRVNDSGLVRECDDCRRPVRGLSGKMAPEGMYVLEAHAVRDCLVIVAGAAR